MRDFATGRDAVRGDAVLVHAGGRAAHERDDAALGRGVVRLRDARRERARGEADHACRSSARGRSAAAARNTVNVPLRWVSMTGSHSSSDMLKSMRSRRMPATHTTPSIRPNVSMPRLHDRRAALHRRDRVGVGDGPAARGLDLLDDRVGDLARRLVAVHRHAVVVDDHGRALGRGGQRDGPADAAPAARNRDHLAVECTHVASENRFQSDGEATSRAAGRAIRVSGRTASNLGDHEAVRNPPRRDLCRATPTKRSPSTREVLGLDGARPARLRLRRLLARRRRPAGAPDAERERALAAATTSRSGSTISSRRSPTSARTA